MKGNKPEFLDSEKPEMEALALDVKDGRMSLPYTPEQFARFLKGLLGRPQEISRIIEGLFEVEQANISDLHHLLGQRIAQQNQGSLIGFQARLVFDDRSSATLRSLDELLSYNETRPVISDALHITWDYLLKFEDKADPERQRIEFSIQASGTGNPVIADSPSGQAQKVVANGSEDDHSVGPYFSYTISHTARTWATDMDTLLANYIHGHLLPQSRLQRKLRKHRKVIGMFFGGTFLMLGMVGLFMAQIEHARPDMPLFNEFLSSLSGSTESEARLSYLVHIEEMRINYRPRRMWLFPLCILTLSAIASFLRVGIAKLANLRESSFILFTMATKRKRDGAAKSLRRRQFAFWLSIVASLASGVAANWFYAMLTG